MSLLVTNGPCTASLAASQRDSGAVFVRIQLWSIYIDM